ncbi:MAG: hypothetical protein ACYSUF_05970, partial [Planctomycetota bacterium]
RAETLLAEINAFLESDEVRGEVREIIERAKAHESEIERTLGSEARWFATILPQFRVQPDLVVRRLWVEARREVMGRDDIEIFRVLPGLGTIDVTISGSEEIADRRRRNRQAQRERDARLKAAGVIEQYQMRAEDFEPGEARPALERDSGDRIRPRGSQR